MDSNPLKRRPGAQPGNTNAVVHGFYSRRLRKIDLAGLEKTEYTTLNDEITLLRVYLRRAIEMGEDSVRTYPESLSLLRHLCIATANINRLVKTQYLLNAKSDPFQDTLDKALEEVHAEIEAENQARIQAETRALEGK